MMVASKIKYIFVGRQHCLHFFRCSEKKIVTYYSTWVGDMKKISQTYELFNVNNRSKLSPTNDNIFSYTFLRLKYCHYNANVLQIKYCILKYAN